MWWAPLYRSTIGKKLIMAVTGLMMVGFVVLHMLGNLQAFQGPERINAYSAFLHSTGELLWVARGVLLVAVILHVDAAVQLTRIARAARPHPYAERRPQVSTLASRTMRWGGVVLGAFIVFHILHMTTGTVHPSFVVGDVYHNLVAGFRVWPVAVAVAVVVAVGFALIPIAVWAGWIR